MAQNLFWNERKQIGFKVKHTTQFVTVNFAIVFQTYFINCVMLLSVFICKKLKTERTIEKGMARK